MKKYTNYKQTNIDWIGEIPSEWDITKIKYSTYVKGRIGWKGLRATDFINEGPYLVTGTDFNNGKINWETCYHVSEDRYKEDPYIQLKNGDVLITKDGTIVKVAVVNGLDDKATLNSGIFVTRPTTGLYNENYFYWILNSETFDKFIEYNKTGSTVLHLYQNVFNEFQFPIPTTEEQKKISRFISYKTSLIDNLISKNNQLIQLLEEKKQATINQAVTKGIDPNVKMKDSGIQWIGEIPEHWGIKKLKHISEIGTGTTPSTSIHEYFENGQINWFTPSDYKGYSSALTNSKRKITQLAVSENSISLLPPETIFFVGIGATAGKVGISTESGYCNQQLNFIQIKQGNSQYFFSLLGLAKDFLFETANSATLPIINQSTLGSLSIVVPLKEEQLAISDFIRKSNIDFENLTKKLFFQNTLLQEYRQALISNAVTGKIDVRDEPIPEKFIKDHTL